MQTALVLQMNLSVRAVGWQWAGLVGLLLRLDAALLNELFSMAQRTRLDQMFSLGDGEGVTLQI